MSERRFFPVTTILGVLEVLRQSEHSLILHLPPVLATIVLEYEARMPLSRADLGIVVQDVNRSVF